MPHLRFRAVEAHIVESLVPTLLNELSSLLWFWFHPPLGRWMKRCHTMKKSAVFRAAYCPSARIRWRA